MNMLGRMLLVSLLQVLVQVLKAHLAESQASMERKFDKRSAAHLATFESWQNDMMEVTGGRARLLEEKLGDAEKELDEFRALYQAEMAELRATVKENHEWATKEFATFNAQILNVQVMLHKVNERVQGVEGVVHAMDGRHGGPQLIF